jgi:hypothetical protein
MIQEVEVGGEEMKYVIRVAHFFQIYYTLLALSSYCQIFFLINIFTPCLSASESLCF